MKAQLVMLSAAGLLLASAAQAAPSADVQRFIDGARVQADQRLDRSGVDLHGQTVKIAGRISGERLTGVRVVGSSGSRDTDDAVAAALRSLPLGAGPAELVGRDITLTLGDPLVRAAR